MQMKAGKMLISHFMKGALALLLIVFTSLQTADAQQTPSEITQARESVFRIGVSVANEEILMGSGFAVSNNTVVTNAHVVDEVLDVTRSANIQANFFVVDSRGERIQVVEVTPFPTTDIAVLRVARTNLRPLPIYSGRLPLDERIWALGYPGTSDLFSASVAAQQTTGTVQSYEQYDEPGPRFAITMFIRHDADIAPGSSGGPLFNRCGQVVGINTLGRSAAGATKGAVASEELITHMAISSRSTRLEVVDRCGGEELSLLAYAGAGLGVIVVGGLIILLFKRRRQVAVSAIQTPAGAAAPGAGAASPAAAAGTDALVVEGIDAAAAFRIEASFNGGNEMVIGRSATSSLVLNYQSVSRSHLKVEKIGSSLMVTDLGSSNGTFIDGKPIKANEARHISPKSVVRIGSINVRISLK